MEYMGPVSPTSSQWQVPWAEFPDDLTETLGPFLISESHTLLEVPHGVNLQSAPVSGTLENAPFEARGDVAVDTQQCGDLVLFSTRCESRRPTKKIFRDRNWTEDETSILVECMRLAFCEQGSPFRQRKPGATHWEGISKEMSNHPGTRASGRTGDQCRLRWDTLVKSHRILKDWCAKNKTSFAELTDEELNGMKLATALKAEWYEVIDFIPRYSRSQKRPRAGIGIPHSRRIESVPSQVTPLIAPADPGSPPLLAEEAPSMITRNAPPSSPSARVSYGRPRTWNLTPKQVAIPGYTFLDCHRRSTLLDLISGSQFLLDRWVDDRDEGNDLTLSVFCQWLSLVQNRSCSDIYDDVFILVKKELVHITSICGVLSVDGSRLRAFDKFAKKVIRKNPTHDAHRHFKLLDDTKFISFREISLPHQIRVLKLHRCRGLERVDFRGLRKVRVLFLYQCVVLKEVIGWRYLRELAWLEIDCCTSYDDYPDLHNLPSLKEFRFNRYSGGPPRSNLSISHCVRLRRLEIWVDRVLEESGDLSSLKCLEVLSFYECRALCSITGLSGLHTLTSLSVAFCVALQKLPDLSHMLELASIDIRRTNLEEIPGVEKLMSLKKIDCKKSKLKHLPDLHHLPALQKLWLEDTPLIEDDPSSFYFDKPEVLFHSEVMIPVDEVSDISDAEYNLSDSSGE